MVFYLQDMTSMSNGGSGNTYITNLTLNEGCIEKAVHVKPPLDFVYTGVFPFMSGVLPILTVYPETKT